MKDLTQEQIKAKLIADRDRLRVTESEIFTMANSYAGDRYGYIAQGLHGVCSNLIHPLHFIPMEISLIKITNDAVKVCTEVELKKALDIQHANYEEYSYYVGGEITCGRMPIKFGPWISERNKET